MKTAKEIKEELIHYFLFNRNFLCMAHEIALYEGIADVSGIDAGGRLVEVEVKVSWADFKSEIDAISQVQTVEGGLFHSDIWPEGIKKRAPKYEKHFLYLRGAEEFCQKRYKRYADLDNGEFVKGQFSKCFLPNKFYFAVPRELKERAIEALQGTPYGLICDATSYKQAKALHKNTLPVAVYALFLRRLSMINYFKEEKENDQD